MDKKMREIVFIPSITFLILIYREKIYCKLVMI